MLLNSKQVLSCTGGSYMVEPADAGLLLEGVSWDSREIKDHDLYVALPGARVDGHNFVRQALEAGADAALVMQPLPEEVLQAARGKGAAIIEVPDTARAVTDLAREWRTHLKGRVIGLTGSTGKTTTKNLIRDVLASAYSTVATVANQNNELGVPKTILNANQDTEAVVVEMGMRGLGQIAELCEFVRPDWGVIVNVGESHIELLGSRENIARAKAELLRDLPENFGRAFINAADDFADFVSEEARLATRGIVRVNFDGSREANERRNADTVLSAPAVWAEDIEFDALGRPSFVLHASGFATPGPGASPIRESVRCKLELRGLHNVSNATSAAAVGRSFGMTLEQVADALASALPESGRQEVLEAPGGFTIVNDAYNANPDSMRASLLTFCSLEAEGKRIAVLGDMGELGDFAGECHERVGRLVGGLPVDLLICVGEMSRIMADAAVDAGFDAERLIVVKDAEEALRAVEPQVAAGDAVLVKASHFMQLNRVAEGLMS